MQFCLISEYTPKGDQPQAIEQVVNELNNGTKDQVLLGITGSGKTFSIAHVIERVQRPALILAHNKTLAAQLYQEFKTFFPENAVECDAFGNPGKRGKHWRISCYNRTAGGGIWTRNGANQRDYRFGHQQVSRFGL